MDRVSAPVGPPESAARDLRDDAPATPLATAWSLVALAGVGASIVYFAQACVGGWVVRFVGENALGRADRMRLLVSMLVGALVPAIKGAVWWRLRGERGAAHVRSAARLAAPLLLVGFVAPLLRSERMELLARVSAMAIVVAASEPLFRMSFAELATYDAGPVAAVRRALGRAAAALEAPRGRISVAAIAALALAAGYAAYMSFFTIRSHRHFGTMAYDLGYYDNGFYNALHGHPFRFTSLIREGDWSALRSHAELSMYALLPVYALFPHAETLLVLQAVALGSAAIPIYRLGARRASRGVGLALVVAYLFYPPLHGANFYDVHFQPFGAAAALWAIDALDAKRMKSFVVFLLLALSSREDIPLVFVALGLYMLAVGCRPKIGAAILAFAGVYFVVLKFGVMPRFGKWWYSDIYKELYPPDEPSYGGVVKTLLTNPVYAWQTLAKPEKLAYALQILVPLAFLPLRGRALWISLLPGAFFTVLTTAYPPTIQISFQYVCYFIALVFPATALALARLRRGLPGAGGSAVAAMLLGTLLTTAAWGAIPPRKSFKGGFGTIDMGPVSEAERQKDRDLRELAAMVPPEATLAIGETELPHVSNRLIAYDLRDGWEGADWLLYSEGSGRFGAEPAKRAMASGQYVEVARRPGGLVLLKKKGN